MELTQTLRQTTRLAMTQHMQQSLQVLQMSTAELCLFLEERARENPWLHVTLPRPRPRDLSPRPDFVPGWAGVEQIEAPSDGLYAYLTDRIELRFADPRRRQVALAFLEALEPSGWLSQPLEAVALASDAAIPIAESVLSELQKIEPAGLFARTLAECLRLQAVAEDMLTWELDALLQNLPLVAEGQVQDLAELCDCAPDDILELVATLRRFDPKPGLQFANDLPPVFPPDLTVIRGDDDWEVMLTSSTLPTLRVLDAPSADLAETKKAARTDAQALAAALEKRNVTLLRVGAALVRRQRAYLEHGRGHLNPLTLEMLAADLGLHPSTVSRVCAGRMIAAPRGALPLKALFSRPVNVANGREAISQDALAEMIRKLVVSEPPDHPLSDEAMVQALADKEVGIARRTVAKYRDWLGIPAARHRKKTV
ncbi:MAG: RNA polymerase factor sigma-54 [Dinoroseobacter sp.]|nr:RNA polymerase factor sigma-54 [Dinoroseobacter sp.]